MGKFSDTAGSRREILRKGAMVLTGGLVLTVGARAQDKMAQDKIAQEMVMYQNQPKDGQRCDACVQWQPPNGCAVVSGNIAPEGWCAAYAPKAG